MTTTITEANFNGPGLEVYPEPVMPQLKVGDILKLSERDGTVYKVVVKSINEDTGEVRLVEVRWGRRFFGEVKRRLDAGEVDYDYSETHEDRVPFTVIRQIYRPLEC